MLQIQNLSAEVGGHKIIKDLSLSIKAGEVLHAWLKVYPRFEHTHTQHRGNDTSVLESISKAERKLYIKV